MVLSNCWDYEEAHDLDAPGATSMNVLDNWRPWLADVQEAQEKRRLETLQTVVLSPGERKASLVMFRKVIFVA